MWHYLFISNEFRISRVVVLRPCYYPLLTRQKIIWLWLAWICTFIRNKLNNNRQTSHSPLCQAPIIITIAKRKWIMNLKEFQFDTRHRIGSINSQSRPQGCELLEPLPTTSLMMMMMKNDKDDYLAQWDDSHVFLFVIVVVAYAFPAIFSIEYWIGVVWWRCCCTAQREIGLQEMCK